MFSNLNNSFQLIKDRTTYEQPLPINLSIPDFDRSFLHVPTHVKNLCRIKLKSKEMFDLEERHVTTIKPLNHSLTKISFQIII